MTNTYSHAETTHSLHSQIEQVTTILGVKGFKPNGWAKRNSKCPFHDDKHPSATLNSEKGLYCPVCVHLYTWKELCFRLGVAWVSPSKNDSYRNQYLTDEVIQKLVGMKRTRACQVLAKLFKDGYEGKVVTISDMVDWTGVSHATADRIAKELFSHLPTYNLKEVGNCEKNSKRGRKTQYYRVPTLSGLEDMLGCDRNKRSHLLEVSDKKWELESEVAALPIKRERTRKAQLPMTYLAKAAGVSPKTARKRIKRVCTVTPNVQDEPLTIEKFSGLAESFREYKFSKKDGGHKFLVVSGVTEVRFAYSKPQAILAIEKAGFIESVIVRTVKANTYEYVGLPDVSLLQKALVVAGARPEALHNDLEPQMGWDDLMADLDAQIEAQKEEDRLWKQQQLDRERNASQLEFLAIVNRKPLGSLSVLIAGD